jgi:glycosyltransferase involved in cell wall biosynthesis
MVSYRGALNPSEVVNIISKYDLLILPSHKENFPMVVLEAMSVGVPVLVMKSCGISETIRKFNDAFVCRDESTTGLIEAFNRLVNGHSAKEREVLINFCEQNFSIANVALSLSTNYNQIIGCDQN